MIDRARGVDGWVGGDLDLAHVLEVRGVDVEEQAPIELARAQLVPEPELALHLEDVLGRDDLAPARVEALDLDRGAAVHAVEGRGKVALDQGALPMEQAHACGAQTIDQPALDGVPAGGVAPRLLALGRGAALAEPDLPGAEADLAGADRGAAVVRPGDGCGPQALNQHRRPP
jgi:hypothetical protein